MTRVLIADDHPVFRSGLRAVIGQEHDMEVCGEAVDGGEAFRKVRELAPDVVLLDLAMPGLSGLGVLRELWEDDDVESSARVLVLTGAIEQREIVAAFQFGARGVALKDAPPALLVRAIRAVTEGQYWVGREAVANVIEALRPRTRHALATHPADHGLTERELAVVSGVVAACANRDIASRLQISEKTVKRHLTNVFDKLGVSTRTELAMFAVSQALPLPPFPRG
jgi:two-component system nitrate/nitrite response regulator NarL